MDGMPPVHHALSRPRGTEAKNSMFTYELNTSTGELLLLHINEEDKGIRNPAFSRMHPHKNVLYSCTESVVDNGKIVAWKLCPSTGKLSHLSTVCAQGTSTCYITIDNKAQNALIVNYWDATVVVKGIDQDTGVMLESKAVYDPNEGRQMAVAASKHVNHSLYAMHAFLYIHASVVFDDKWSDQETGTRESMCERELNLPHTPTTRGKGRRQDRLANSKPSCHFHSDVLAARR